jgi:hypothetical protein
MPITLMMKQENSHLVPAAPGRSPEIPEEDDVYGWLVGKWEFAVTYYRAKDVSDLNLKGEVQFGWALEGRAVQSVWALPRQLEHSPDTGEASDMLGTTLRVWDPSIRAWRLSWTNPVRVFSEDLIGKRIGDEIVQTGARSDGAPARWRFTDITPDSFRWIGDVLLPDGETWKLEAEFLVKRIPA